MSQTDPDWCQRLYENEAARMLLYGRALGLSHCEAEDILQDTFIALADRDEPPRSPRHYALRSFRNRALNYRRSLWRRCLKELESRRWFESAPDESPMEPAAKRCLAQLPTDQREVIVLKIWHQMTYEQMSQLLDVPANTLAGRYRYGLQKIRRCLNQPSNSPETVQTHGKTIAILEATTPVSFS